MHTEWGIVAADGTMEERWRVVAKALLAIALIMALLLGVIPAWYAPSTGVIFLAFAPAIVGLSLWFIDYALRLEGDDDGVTVWRDHIPELVIAPCLVALFAAIMAVLLIAILTHFIFYTIF
jgi:hypothetical protein